MDGNEVLCASKKCDHRTKENPVLHSKSCISYRINLLNFACCVLNQISNVLLSYTFLESSSEVVEERYLYVVIFAHWWILGVYG